MEKMRAIMDTETEMIPNCEFSSLEEVKNFERENDVTLPEDYAQFLFECGGRFTAEYFYYKPIHRTPRSTEMGYGFVNYFYGTDIVQNDDSSFDMFKEDFDSNLLPIAEVGGGDLICIGVQGEYFGKVYCWIHDIWITEHTIDSVFLVANSFSEFIDSFEYCESV